MHKEVKSIQKEVGGTEINITGDCTGFEEEDISPSKFREQETWVGVEVDMSVEKQLQSQSLPCLQV